MTRKWVTKSLSWINKRSKFPCCIAIKWQRTCERGGAPKRDMSENEHVRGEFLTWTSQCTQVSSRHTSKQVSAKRKSILDQKCNLRSKSSLLIASAALSQKLCNGVTILHFHQCCCPLITFRRAREILVIAGKSRDFIICPACLSCSAEAGLLFINRFCCLYIKSFRGREMLPFTGKSFILIYPIAFWPKSHWKRKNLWPDTGFCLYWQIQCAW